MPLMLGIPKTFYSATSIFNDFTVISFQNSVTSTFNCFCNGVLFSLCEEQHGARWRDTAHPAPIVCAWDVAALQSRACTGTVAEARHVWHVTVRLIDQWNNGSSRSSCTVTL